jgi:hypothetical protein
MGSRVEEEELKKSIAPPFKMDSTFSSFDVKN